MRSSLTADEVDVLQRVKEYVYSAAWVRGWPITDITVRDYQDLEITTWWTTIIAPVFDCSFEQADKYLHELYGDLDRLTSSLSERDRIILREKFSFSVEVAA